MVIRMELVFTFITWETLTTYTGVLVMVLILTQLTKDLPFIKKLPTQLWSYLLTLLVMYPAAYFSGTCTPANTILILFNAAVVTLASNGGYDLLKHLLTKKNTDIKSESPIP